jgi:hypothetical protein
MYEATPAEIAVFDQSVAQNMSDLAQLIDIWRATKVDIPEHYALAGFARSLYKQVEPEALAELLTIAIWKYSGPRGQTPACCGPPHKS